MSLKTTPRQAGRPAVPATPATPGMADAPSVSMPRDYQLRVVEGNYPGSVKLIVRKFGVDASSIHISKTDLAEMARLVSTGGI